MTVEAVTYISDLNASYPATADAKSEGDDHIRNLKTGIKATFPNVSGAVTPTHTELNYVDGVTSAIQTQLDAKASTASLAAVAVGSFALVVETATAVTGVVGTEHALTNVSLSTVTLPASPTAGNSLRVTVCNGLATNVIARNGNNIHSLAEDMTLTNAEGSFTLRYINSTVGWRLV